MSAAEPHTAGASAASGSAFDSTNPFGSLTTSGTTSASAPAIDRNSILRDETEIDAASRAGSADSSSSSSTASDTSHSSGSTTSGLFPAETHQFAAEQQTSRCADGTTFSGIGSGPVLVLSPSLTGPSQAHQTASGVTNASHSSAEVVRTPSTATGPHGKFAPIGPITTLPTNGHQLCQGLQIAPGKALSVGDVQLLEPSRDPYVIAGFWHHNSWRAVVVRAGDQQYGKVEDQPASHLKQKYQGNRAADFAANSSNHTALFERAKTWAESKQPTQLQAEEVRQQQVAEAAAEATRDAHNRLHAGGKRKRSASVAPQPPTRSLPVRAAATISRARTTADDSQSDCEGDVESADAMTLSAAAAAATPKRSTPSSRARGKGKAKGKRTRAAPATPKRTRAKSHSPSRSPVRTHRTASAASAVAAAADGRMESLSANVQRLTDLLTQHIAADAHHTEHCTHGLADAQAAAAGVPHHVPPPQDALPQAITNPYALPMPMPLHSAGASSSAARDVEHAVMLQLMAQQQAVFGLLAARLR